MNVSMPGQLPGQNGAAAGTAPHAGKDMVRRIRTADGLRMLLLGADPDPKDTALFRMLLSDDVADKPAQGIDRRDADAGCELPACCPDRQDDVARVAARHAGVDKQESDIQDVAPTASLDLVALRGVVTKVYLDSLHDRGRGISVALDDNLLPATRLSVLEQEGRLAVDFVSINQHSRARLRRGAPALAERISRELSRDVCVKVAAHDGDRIALEARANADAASTSRGPI